eukprot:gnl/TRDRNA2_/TRDRNA2_176136_c0_seq1.p1 gnl/TRDRNA2_/TRDRNA2_176136_c0~~gnl/TRDRNA2_/TRDRNA2_176136_c0_seq1.p1  ORF type:complete len:382 (-),score=81.19 gnl/TRDRNA2_/TRDRNA2_176136_c0_seq1:71-1135(-)
MMELAVKQHIAEDQCRELREETLSTIRSNNELKMRKSQSLVDLSRRHNSVALLAAENGMRERIAASLAQFGSRDAQVSPMIGLRAWDREKAAGKAVVRRHSRGLVAGVTVRQQAESNELKRHFGVFVARASKERDRAKLVLRNKARKEEHQERLCSLKLEQSCAAEELRNAAKVRAASAEARLEEHAIALREHQRKRAASEERRLAEALVRKEILESSEEARKLESFERSEELATRQVLDLQFRNNAAHDRKIAVNREESQLRQMRVEEARQRKDLAHKQITTLFQTSDDIRQTLEAIRQEAQAEAYLKLRVSCQKAAFASDIGSDTTTSQPASPCQPPSPSEPDSPWHYLRGA